MRELDWLCIDWISKLGQGTIRRSNVWCWCLAFKTLNPRQVGAFGQMNRQLKWPAHTRLRRKNDVSVCVMCGWWGIACMEQNQFWLGTRTTLYTTMVWNTRQQSIKRHNLLYPSSVIPELRVVFRKRYFRDYQDFQHFQHFLLDYTTNLKGVAPIKKWNTRQQTTLKSICTMFWHKMKCS